MPIRKGPIFMVKVSTTQLLVDEKRAIVFLEGHADWVDDFWMYNMDIDDKSYSLYFNLENGIEIIDIAIMIKCGDYWYDYAYLNRHFWPPILDEFARHVEQE